MNGQRGMMDMSWMTKKAELGSPLGLWSWVFLVSVLYFPLVMLLFGAMIVSSVIV